MLLSSLKDLFRALTYQQRTSLYKIQFLVIFMAISEVIGISTIGPFLALVSDTSLLEQDGFLRSVYLTSGAQSHNEFIFYAGEGVLFVLFSAAIVSSLSIRGVVYSTKGLGEEV